MRTYARWILVSAAALLFVPLSWATVQVVDADGTIYTVEVASAAAGASPAATQLTFTRNSPDGAQTHGVIRPAPSGGGDRDPVLLLVPGSSGPALIWSRQEGSFDRIAYSRYSGGTWSEVRYFTNTPHLDLPDGKIADGEDFMTITGTTNLAREGIDERQFRFGLRVLF